MIYTLGESLMDIIFNYQQNIIANAGGGMLNTSISLSRAGLQVSLVSELGDDLTAVTIIDFLNKNRVIPNFIKKYFKQNTSIALAYLDENKIPSFSIYKSYPPTRQLIKPQSFTDRDFLVFGSMYSIEPAIRNDIKEIAAHAKLNNAIVVYDPNIRTHDLTDPEIKNALYENMAYADIVKASDEDMKNIFGDIEYNAFYEELKKINNEVIFILTLGKEGAIGYCKNTITKVNAEKVSAVSTIGAGDAFNAGIVYFLEKRGIRKQYLKNHSKVLLEDILKSGTKFSAAVCSTDENYLPINSL